MEKERVCENKWKAENSAQVEHSNTEVSEPMTKFKWLTSEQSTVTGRHVLVFYIL